MGTCLDITALLISNLRAFKKRHWRSTKAARATSRAAKKMRHRQTVQPHQISISLPTIFTRVPSTLHPSAHWSSAITSAIPSLIKRKRTTMELISMTAAPPSLLTAFLHRHPAVLNRLRRWRSTRKVHINPYKKTSSKLEAKVDANGVPFSTVKCKHRHPSSKMLLRSL